MQFVKCEISTICIGLAASMGSLLLAAGSTGKRHILPHSRVMIHQPLIMGHGISGQATDIEIHAKEIINTKRILTEIYMKHTGQKYEELEKAMDRDNFMSAKEAVAYGLADKVIS